MIRLSSVRSRSGAKIEARRDLDRGRRPRLCGKPRPVVIVQDDRFDATRSVTICGFTTTEVEAQYIRLSIVPTDANCLKEASHLMVDKLSTVPRNKLGRRIGRLDEDDVVRVNRAMMMFLGVSGS